MENQEITTAERVGQNVRRLRKARDLTLADLSERLTKIRRHIGVPTLSKIELGQRKISVEDLEALAEALEVTVDRLLALPDADIAERLESLFSQLDAADEAVARAVGQYEGVSHMLRQCHRDYRERTAMQRGVLEQIVAEFTENQAEIDNLPEEIASRVYSAVNGFVPEAYTLEDISGGKQ